MNEKEITGIMTAADAIKRIKNAKRLQALQTVRPLFNLFDGPAVVELLQNETVLEADWQVAAFALTEFTRDVFPYLTPAELNKLKSELKPLIDPKVWPTDHYKRPPMAFFLAALSGMPEELLAVLRSIPDDHYNQSGWDHTYYHQPQRIVFGLASPQLVESEMRRLKLPIREPQFIRSWLARTGFAALDYVRDNILAETRRDECGHLIEEFARVKAPEAAPTCWS